MSTRTAHDMVQEAARIVNWEPPKDCPPLAAHDAARSLASVYAYWTAVSLEALRRINPDVAERLANHIDGDMDWGIACEWAYAWEQSGGVPSDDPVLAAIITPEAV